MKKILLTLAGFIVTLLSIAQSPNLMNYQGVARNAAGNVLPNQNIALRLSILNGGPAGTVVYQETRTMLTNAFGLFNVVVGSPGATNVTGTIGGINWTAFGVGSGTKFLQVEIDPVGGSSFVNVGSTQLVSVPYAMNATSAAPVGPAGGDLTGTYPNPQLAIPLIKTASVTTSPMISMTNTATTGTTSVFGLLGSSASTDGNASAVQGIISSTAPGGFSAGVRGVNNGTSGLGIGVYGSQAGSGWGVYGTAPNGIGVNGSSTAGFGVNGSSTTGVGVNGSSSTSNAGFFQITNAANTTSALVGNSNGSGASVEGTNTGTGRGGFFQVLNAASTADAVRAETNGTGASWGIRAISSGTNGAGLFQQTNATNTSNNVQSTQAGLGRAGLFNITNAANTGNALEANTNGTGSAVVGNKSSVTGTTAAVLGTSASTDASAFAVQGIISSTNPGGFSTAVRGINNGTGGLGIGVWGSQAGSGWGVYGNADGGIGAYGNANSGFGIFGLSNSGTGVNGQSTSGVGGRFTSSTGLALHTTGGVRLEGIGEAANRLLISDATGNATWQTPGSIGIITGSGTLNFIPKWTPSGIILGNSSIFDDGTFVGVGTSTPTTNKFHVLETGANSAAMMQITNPASTSTAVNVTTNGIGGGITVQQTNAGNGARGIDVLQTGVGPGVFATSTGGIAVWGITSTISGAGALGDNTFGEAVVGRNRGGNGVGAVVGRNDSSGYGVRGFNTKNGIGVLGQTGISGGQGTAGRFENVNAANTNTTVVVATNGIGGGIQVDMPNASNGARGIDVNQQGVGPGVFAISQGGNAVWGITSSISAAGVIGDNTFGEAVVGRNRGGNGVGAVVGRNDSSGYGVRGFNTKNGIGVLGQTGISGGTGQAGRFENVNAANGTDVVTIASNGTGTGLVVNNANGAATNLAIFKKSSGNVARIADNGQIFANGGFTVGGADVAEYFAAEGEFSSYEPGDVLVISQTSDRKIEKSSTPYSTLVSGVYATKPGIKLTEENAVDGDLSQLVPMGVIGVIPTKVCLEGGAIKRGDLLVTSSIPGVAMKADLDKVKVGQVVGKALQDFDATTTGKINVLVSVK